MPIVSVIIPSYNHSIFLEQRIRTVLNQTYADFELIILDDCSTDNSRNIIEKYRGHNKISHIVYNNENTGSPFVQWKKGVDLANGNYIWIAESDDFADESFLSEIMECFAKDAQVGVAYCDSNVIENGEIKFDYYKKHRNTQFNTTYWNNDYVSIGKFEINNYMIFDCTINNTSAMVFKKSAIKNAVFEELTWFKYSGDWLFFLTLITDCKIAYISKCLNYKRKEGDNFKPGIRTRLNYFRERSLVRFLILHRVSFDDFTLHKILQKIRNELKAQIVNMINANGDFNELNLVFMQLRKANESLYENLIQADPLLSEFVRIQ